MILRPESDNSCIEHIYLIIDFCAFLFCAPIRKDVVINIFSYYSRTFPVQPAITAERLLRRVGFVLLGLGITDLLFLLYSVIADVSYTSSINIFAIVGGIFMLRKNQRAARFIRAVATFSLVGVLSSPFLLLGFQPFELILIEARLYFSTALISVSLWIVSLSLFTWIIRQLTLPQVRLEIDGPDHDWRPFAPVTLALLCLAILAAAISIGLHGVDADIACAEAAREYGADYKYAVKSLAVDYQDDHRVVHARVSAYRPNEIRIVSLRWSTAQ